MAGLFDDVLGTPAAPPAAPGPFDDVLGKQPAKAAAPAAESGIIHHDTAAGNFFAPLTDFQPYLGAIEAERRGRLEEAAREAISADTTWDRLKATGKTALEALNYAWTPVTAAERSLVGAPLESGLGIPHEYTESAADVAVPFLGEERLGAKALSAARSEILKVPESTFAKPFVQALAPASMPGAKPTAEKAIHTFGELAARTEQAHEQVDVFRKFMDTQPEAERLQFIYRHERGMQHDNPLLNEASATIKRMFDQRVEEVQAFGEGHLASVIEHYFPHIWEDPKKAKDLFAQAFGKSPLLGSKNFLKQRTYEYVNEGLQAGLKLANPNPINAVLLKVREMDRFIVGKRLVDQLKNEGTLKFFPPGKLPNGWKIINDPVARVRQWSEEEGGFIDRGNYAAPENAARILNNALTPSALKGNPYFDALRGAGNTINMSQLGVSAFHFSFTTVDSITSKVALGAKQLARGDVGEGLKSLAEAPVAPVQTFRKGHALRDAYLHPGIATPEMQAMVDSVIQAGGRARMPRDFAATAQGSFIKAAREGTLLGQLKSTFKDNGIWGGSMHTAARLAETTSAWMMEGAVPRMKMGVFYDMVHDTMKAHPNMSPEQFRSVVQKHWASVDNRMGEMVYDNLFWNKTGKDVMHLAVRSVGWNLGTFRELGGGVADGVKLVDALVRGDKAEFTDRLAYTIALPVTIGTMGAMTQYALTGEGPKELKDYFFPRTGKTTKYGTPDRLSLPSYMKDVYEYGHDATQTLINKAHPIIPLMQQMATNRDYFGYPITDRHHEDPQQFLTDYIKFIGKGVLPFSVQGIMHAADKDESMKKYLALIGLTPAPGYITSPEEIAAADRKREDQLLKRKERRAQ